MQSNRGEVSLREYILGYWEIVKPVVTEELVHTTYSVLDQQHTAKITKDQLTLTLEQFFQLTPEESAHIYEEIDSENRGFITEGENEFECRHCLLYTGTSSR